MAITAVFLIGLALIAAVAACVVLVRRWRREQAEVRRVRDTFARYVPPSIVNELLDRKDEQLFSGRQVRVTILVCRIWNFAQVIEKLSPEQTLRYLNEFYAMAGSSIERRRGIVHHFLEDGIVGVFGVPLDDPLQEDHALRAAINIVRLVSLMQEKWAQQNRRPLSVGVGINSGEVIAGDAGFANRREYTVVGPDVALAHKLAAATVDLNAAIVAARSTAEPVQDLYVLLPVNGVPLNGVRTLLDAFIVRSRKRPDAVNLPRAEAFANTVLDDPLTADLDVDDPLPPEPATPIPFVPIGKAGPPEHPAPLELRPAEPSPPSPPQPSAPVTRIRPRPLPNPAPPHGSPAAAAASPAQAAPSAAPPPEPERAAPPPAASPPQSQPLIARPRRPPFGRPPDRRPPERAPERGGEPAAYNFDLPELRMHAGSFDTTDEGPIMPDLPSRSTYEDNDGPPIPL